MGKKDRQPLTPEVDPQDVGTNPEDQVPRAVMTERLSRQRTLYEGQLTAMGATNDSLIEQNAGLTTALEEATTAKTTAEEALATANEEAARAASDATLAGGIASAGGGELDEAIKKTILDRYAAIEGDKPDFAGWLGEDVVAKSLLGAKAPKGDKTPKPKPTLPATNTGEKDVTTQIREGLTDADVRGMSLDELKAHQKQIFSPDGFSFAEG